MRGCAPQNHLFGGVWRAEGAHQRLRMQKNLVLSLPWRRCNRRDIWGGQEGIGPTIVINVLLWDNWAIKREEQSAADLRGNTALRWLWGPGNTGGEGGIRTLEGFHTLLVFETSTFNRSVTSPDYPYYTVKQRDMQAPFPPRRASRTARLTPPASRRPPPWYTAMYSESTYPTHGGEHPSLDNRPLYRYDA